MDYAQIPHVRQPVSRIIFGTAINSMQWCKDCDELLDGLYALGINTFDTARCYMGAERTLGKWMAKRGLRDKLVIETKGALDGFFKNKRINERCIRSDLQKSLRRLGTDHVEIYMLHRDDPTVAVGEIVEVLNALHSEGVIGAFGGSNWTYQRVEEANEYAYAHNLIPMEVSSPNFGLADQVRDPWGGGCVTISGPKNVAAREWYQKTQLPVMAYSCLGRGLFSGAVKSDDWQSAQKRMDGPARKGYLCAENMERLRRVELFAKQKNMSVPQVALSWIFNQGLNVFALVSVSKVEHMIKNIEAMQFKMTKEESDALNLLNDSLFDK
jgi:aryl-alcohol dehydrogenase-like predicted oxidoreductase